MKKQNFLIFQSLNETIGQERGGKTSGLPFSTVPDDHARQKNTVPSAGAMDFNLTPFATVNQLVVRRWVGVRCAEMATMRRFGSSSGSQIRPGGPVNWWRISNGRDVACPPRSAPAEARKTRRAGRASVAFGRFMFELTVSPQHTGRPIGVHIYLYTQGVRVLFDKRNHSFSIYYFSISFFFFFFI